MTETHEIRTLPVSQIELNPKTQVRFRLDKGTIREYAEAMKAGDRFPEIDVFVEEGSERYICASGFHRVNAASLAGIAEINCRIHAGTLHDAQRLALGSNAEHGLRRTSKDKRKAVEIALLDPTWSQWSNRHIAGLCRVDEKTVRKVRGDLIVNGKLEESDEVLAEQGGKTVKQPRKKGKTKGADNPHLEDYPKEKQAPAKPKKQEMTAAQKKAARQVREADKREKREKLNRREFFAGLSQMESACAMTGKEVRKRWAIDKEDRDHITLVRDWLNDILED